MDIAPGAPFFLAEKLINILIVLLFLVFLSPPPLCVLGPAIFGEQNKFFSLWLHQSEAISKGSGALVFDSKDESISD